ncbi:MAG TPA: hypothetical protein VFN26_14905 [Candidatus Acidoferrum sp.]|nr:hypothetical protein [Candidatus Acidoferrum sp.]
MIPLLQQFVAETNAQFGDRLRSTEELFDQHITEDQFLDATVIGGYGLRDIFAGNVHESQISPLVIRAFHSQYPRAGSFVEFVRDHKGDASLLGIINGIKGKTFELEYLDYLNHGHLPPGAFAESATSPTQEGWDIAIQDAHGHIIQHLQLKATESMSYIADAIAHHPEIDVVATHEVFEHMDDPKMLSHIIDSGISNGQLEDLVADPVHDVAPHFVLIPWAAFGVIAFQSWRRYKRGAPLGRVIRLASRRASYSTASQGAGYFATLLAHEPFVGVVSSLLFRLSLGRYDAQREFLEFLGSCRKQQQSRLASYM